ncbi:hypothetical protein NDU88_011075 [Pleurodeles waltl]|uniref:Uncharacterized protein n=1 Tax=Pleurodeles waltl TaxID=8319 RepID=A0AAV7PZM7_PLEWA|nr:hypothetical protein NDU88_011075 [Pleurodeles waltl]
MASLGRESLAVLPLCGAGVEPVVGAILDGRNLYCLVFLTRSLPCACAHVRMCRFSIYHDGRLERASAVRFTAQTGTMEQYDPYEAQGETQDMGPSFEDSLVEALDSNVQYSVNKALRKALGPLTSHLKGFARQQAWLPSLPFSESTSQNSNPVGKAKGKSQGKRWHSDAFEQFSASVLADHGYSHSSQATTSSDNSNYPDALSSDSSSQDSSDNDQVHLPDPSKKRRQDCGSDPSPSPPKEMTISNLEARWFVSWESFSFEIFSWSCAFRIF